VRYFRLELDASLTSCATRSIKTHARKFDGKETFGHDEIAVRDM